MRGFVLRLASIDDVDVIVELRGELQRETGELPQDRHLETVAAQREWFSQHLAGEAFDAWLAETVDGEVVACSGVALMDVPPYPENLAGQEAYVMNMYTRPAWRRRGIASQIVARIVADARARGVGKVWLRSEPNAERLYGTAGFTAAPGYMEQLTSAVVPDRPE